MKAHERGMECGVASRPALARPCRHLPLRRRHAFKASTAAAPGSIPAQADAGRGLLHARALLPAQGLEKVRRASCHCNLLPWLHPCIAHAFPLMWCCALLSFVHILQVSCICLTVLTSAGAFERSEIQEWPLDGVSGLRCSAGPFVGERDVCAVSILLQRTCRLDSPGTCVH